MSTIYRNAADLRRAILDAAAHAPADACAIGLPEWRPADPDEAPANIGRTEWRGPLAEARDAVRSFVAMHGPTRPAAAQLPRAVFRFTTGPGSVSSLAVVRTAPRLAELAETVRKRWALFGGGAKPEEIKPRQAPRRAEWSPAIFKAWRLQLQDADHVGAMLTGERIGARYYPGGGERGCFALAAPVQVQGMPAGLCSFLRDDGRWIVADEVSGLAVGDSAASRRAAEAGALQRWADASEEKRAAAMERARRDPPDLAAARAAWCKAYGIADPAAPAAPAEDPAPAADLAPAPAAEVAPADLAPPAPAAPAAPAAPLAAAPTPPDSTSREGAPDSTSRETIGAAPVAGLYGDGAPDPRNSAPLAELDGFRIGQAVDVPSRTIGRSTVQVLFLRAMAGFDTPGTIARIVNAEGKRLDVLTSELKPAPAAAPIVCEEESAAQPSAAILAAAANARSATAADEIKLRRAGLMRAAADGWLSVTDAGRAALTAAGYAFEGRSGWTLAAPELPPSAPIAYAPIRTDRAETARAAAPAWFDLPRAAVYRAHVATAAIACALYPEPCGPCEDNPRQWLRARSGPESRRPEVQNMRTEVAAAVRLARAGHPVQLAPLDKAEARRLAGMRPAAELRERARNMAGAALRSAADHHGAGPAWAASMAAASWARAAVYREAARLADMAAPPPAAHLLTLAQYLALQPAHYAAMLRPAHRRDVARAIERGETLPAAVLADYPDLAPPDPGPSLADLRAANDVATALAGAVCAAAPPERAPAMLGAEAARLRASAETAPPGIAARWRLAADMLQALAGGGPETGGAPPGRRDAGPPRHGPGRPAAGGVTPRSAPIVQLAAWRAGQDPGGAPTAGRLPRPGRPGAAGRPGGGLPVGAAAPPSAPIVQGPGGGLP